MDRLRIKDLVVYANHGVFAAEKELGQRFILDVELYYDMTEAAKLGNLEASVHYGELAQSLTEWCQAESYDLIETLAYRLIEKTFQAYPLVKEMSLEVKKPWAPIPLPLDRASIRLVRKKRKVFIGLGSNQGDKEALLADAKRKMEDLGITILQASSLLRTQPWGGVDQDDFLNQVIEVETWLEPDELMTSLLEIERQLGRVREVKWGPRTIDLDILFIDREVHYSPHLIVPHPYLAERAFVLESLQEIAPHFVDPHSGKSIRHLWEECQKNK